MVEDTDGNYMTEAEITKAAHWFMKNAGDADIQHCFEKAEGVEVVESYVAKSDMEIEGQPIKKGTWLMTMEVSDDGVWDKIEKGEITGFSMGGKGSYSEVDVDISDPDNPVEKAGGIISGRRFIPFPITCWKHTTRKPEDLSLCMMRARSKKRWKISMLL